jgi:hypothetical protein
MSNVVKAILKINPNAQVSVKDDDVNEIIWENGTTPIPKTDIEAKVLVVAQEEADEITATANKKASGKQKLLDLGLSEEEVKALIGA